jgi:4-amino-4-deoxy-L-arabinose transferase-like glycosyltransferase
MSKYRSHISNGLLTLIVAIYFVLGLAYAVETPKWQVPDEPAHYNYVLYLAENYRFPVLQMGDYPHQYLEEIKAAKFPPHMSIAPIRYESHQPPLYYLLAAVLYKATSFLGFEGQFLILRFFSVFLGCLLLLVVYTIVKEIFPDQEFLALTTTALIATVPMHIAMSAAINNDTLAELILATIVWLCIKSLKKGLTQRQVLFLGLLLALALLTKATIYAPAILSIILALGVRARVEGKRAFLRQLGFISGIALLSCWWFLRNVLTYGDLDLFGWQRHDSIVMGQPTTAQWISEYGLSKVLQDFFVVSFHSFWAQFGWMGILVDSRLYLLLAIISIVVGMGFILFLARIARDRERLTSFQWWALGLLLLVFVLVTAAHVLYNFKFVQHQGRYLFPSLVPIGLAFALGMREWVNTLTYLLSRIPRLERFAAPFDRIGKGLAFSLFYAGFLALDVVCLFGFIVPYFQG